MFIGFESDFLIRDLHLCGDELLVYAIIDHVSNIQWYMGGPEAIAEALYIPVEHAEEHLESLVNQKLINRAVLADTNETLYRTARYTKKEDFQRR